MMGDSIRSDLKRIPDLYIDYRIGELSMNEETNTNIETNEADYINAINELKQNTVSKEQYDKLRQENKQLLNTLVTNGQINNVVEETAQDPEELRKKLFHNKKELTNLDYWKTALDFRDALMQKGERDPFISHSAKGDGIDEATAERISQNIRECIDFADGDSSIFTMELQRRMIDTMPLTSRNK